MNFREINNVSILNTPQRLDAISAPRLKERVKEMAQGHGLKLVIDMGDTVFIDSSGCQVLISIMKTLAGQKGDMKIARPTRRVFEILQLTRLHRAFEIFPSVEGAVESFI
ncbi:MAG: STAS domain-containing protein [Desulfomonilaceae bacterium]